MVPAPIFRHAVASGDPLQARVVIWSRVTMDVSAPVDVGWQVARDREFRDVVASGDVPAGAESDYTVKVDVGGLEPATTYYYAFHVADETSPVGRTRTLPEGPDQIRFAMSSCAKYNAGYFNAYSRIAARDDVLFLLHLGDYIYEAADKPPPSQYPGADIGRHYDPLHECVTLADYRRRYSQYRQDPDVQNLHLTHPVIATVDDHEFADGVWRGGSVEHRPERDGPWEERRASAFRARWEWQPARMPDPEDPERVFRSVRLGDLAEIFLLDTRTRRDEPIAGEAMLDPARTQLGPDQKKWFKESIGESSALWKLIGNSSVMSSTWADHIPEDVKPSLIALKLVAPGGLALDPDQWDGYPFEREEILKYIRDEVSGNTVVLSGDVHIAMANELLIPGDRRTIAPEFVTTSLTTQNIDEKMHWEARTKSVEVERMLMEAMPHIRWCDFDSHGYILIDVDRDQLRTEWWFVDTVLKRTESEKSGGAWAVKNGEAGLHPITVAGASA